MSYYQGRALRAGETRPPARGPRRLLPLLQVLGLMAVIAGLAHLPWGELRRRWLVIDEVRVTGVRYLDAARVREIAGLAPGGDLLDADLERARQSLLLQPRISSADVKRHWPRGLVVSIVEREPVMLVQREVPWEVDSAGVLLPPLGEGVVADVPLLAGTSFDGVEAGTQLATPDVQRGLAWVRALSNGSLQLQGQVSELDVTEPDVTELVMMSGTRVLAQAWPPTVRELTALRVVLADLRERGVLADEVDLRFRDQVIVRPAEPVDPSGQRPGNRS